MIYCKLGDTLPTLTGFLKDSVKSKRIGTPRIAPFVCFSSSFSVCILPLATRLPFLFVESFSRSHPFDTMSSHLDSMSKHYTEVSV